ncbi:LOW QUALITY PROTEIN: T-cell surface glycoprotein CD1c [Trichechus manatus latirostris]|uniref:LOW QUALITY PROTEIN: T-cell surface glycoprotein CD1c n=1 Tax=Trichechus manatus latirostris TaxID=127582 RepID=A0A2Y9G4H3_TRIMA|nr:LOW QUALITY PROTEIN: T-cell surface glycoprotein CD1c [Trichechus manatus latirostris]
MLFLQFPLLAVLLPGGSNEEVFQEPVSFYLIQISSFANKTWAQNQGSGWLDELLTHGWESELGTIIFLHAWSKGNFSDAELMDLELLFRVYFIGFIREIQDHASALKLEYPFELQVSAGCELHSGRSPKGFFHVAYQGSDFLSFQNMSWVPSPKGESRAQNVCNLINQYQGIQETVQRLVRNSCPQFVFGLLDAGRMDLQRQVRPQVWLSSSPTLSPDWLLLVCHVSGFYPKLVWVTWMWGEQEQPDTKQGDILPIADGTWYLWVILNMMTEDAAGLSCQVRHSSLGSEDIIIYWSNHISMNFILIPLGVILPLMLLIGLVVVFKKHW